MTASNFGRPRDQDQLRALLRRAHRDAPADVVFAGLTSTRGVRLTEFIGARTSGLRGLEVRDGNGLGGRAALSQRPVGTTNYASARDITHDYDGPVLREGIRSVIAVPVVLDGRTRALFYAATRGAAPLGDRVGNALVAAGKLLATRLRLEDEVDRRVARIWAASPADVTSRAGAPSVAELRDVHRELRSIAATIDDPAVRERLRAATERLCADPTSLAGSPLASLTPRELDVLAEVALGCSNAEAAQRLAVSTETVKAYLKSVMRKLDATNRHQAVTEARRYGLLP